MFYRSSRWKAWRVTDVMSGLWADTCWRNFTGELKELVVKKIEPGRVKALAQHLDITDGLEKHPLLLGFFSDALFQTDAGVEPREAGTMFLMPKGGGFLVILKEPSQGLKLVVEVKSLRALWTTLEAALGSESSMWETDPYATRKRPKRK
jgi:hypothetical protein